MDQKVKIDLKDIGNKTERCSRSISAPATEALHLVGPSVTLTDNTATLASGNPATWNLNASAGGTAGITITNSAGQTANTGTTTLNAGANSYIWNGQDNNGVTWPAGPYTIAVTCTGASGQAITVTSQWHRQRGEHECESADLTVNGQSYPTSSIQSVGGGSNGTLCRAALAASRP